MASSRGTWSKVLAGAAISLLALLFGFSLLKNISYPLLWNDEAETAEFGNRILEFGYPKIHDGKNVLYLLDHPDQSLMVRPQLDAFVGMGWVQYYFAAPGAALATLTSDLYLKTAWMRLPFALAGAAGLLVLTLIPLSFKIEQQPKYWFIALFLLLELLSVSLVLHLREVRYYSLTILLTALALYFYVKRQPEDAARNVGTGLALAGVLILLFNTFYPSYISLSVGLVLSTMVGAGRRGTALGGWWWALIAPTVRTKLWYQLWPVVLALALVIPCAVFFKTLTINYAFRLYFHPSLGLYIYNLSSTVKFFTRYEFLPAALATWVTRTALSQRGRLTGWAKDCCWYSSFLMGLCLIHLLLVATIPYPTFERYVIMLQPLLATTLSLDAVVTLWLIQNHYSGELGQRLRLATSIVLCGSLLLFLPTKIQAWYGHLHELTHRYEGPLDFVIPYLQQHYANPASLTIATNYEEPAYMYYLRSRVIVGFVFNNIAVDAKLTPDVIIKRRGQVAYQTSVGRPVSDIFARFLEQAPYQLIHFPITDYYFNNIPELAYFHPHLFATPTTANPDDQLTAYLRLP